MNLPNDADPAPTLQPGVPAATRPFDLTLRRVEILAALAVTAWAVFLHLLFLLHAGPLWRDEAGTINFAQMPTLHDIWHNMQYDNFPPLFVLTARAWGWLAGDTDFSWRILGFCIGLMTLAALWFAVRSLGARTPLIALVLYGINPLAVKIGDTMRPYGIGVAFTLLTLTFLWRFVDSPSPGRFLCAALAALLSVQSLYQGAVFLAAFSVGAWAVAVSRRQWKLAFQVLAIAAVATISLLPYLDNIRKAEDWAVLLRTTVTRPDIINVVWTAWRAGGAWFGLIWLWLLVAAFISTGLCGIMRKQMTHLFCGSCLICATILYLAFLKTLSFAPRPWYSLILLAPMAVLMDALLSAIPLKLTRITRPVLVLLVVAASAPACIASVQFRQSNVDLIATKLKASVQPGDMVLVARWYEGVSLQRYYPSGNWVTVPPMPDLRIHRYDLVYTAMKSENPMASVLSNIEKTLRAGHTLWVVGELSWPPHGGGMKRAVTAQWESWIYQVAALLDNHRAHSRGVDIPVSQGQRVNYDECLPLVAYRGWHELANKMPPAK